MGLKRVLFTTLELVVLSVLVSFSLSTSTHQLQLAAPLAKLMLYGHVAFHVQVKKQPGTSTLSETIGPHITSIDPKQVLEHKLVKKFPKVLHMAEQGLLNWLLDESGRDSSKKKTWHQGTKKLGHNHPASFCSWLLKLTWNHAQAYTTRGL
jgi:hypothetical protein